VISFHDFIPFKVKQPEIPQSSLLSKGEFHNFNY